MIKAGRDEQGQALTETMIMMLFLLMLIWGTVFLSLFAATKYMVNFAAFAAARTTLSVDRTAVEAWSAADSVMSNLRWWRDPSKNRPDAPLAYTQRFGRFGVLVTHHVPFGLPIFNEIPNGGIRVIGFAPTVQQNIVPFAAEIGDNR